MQMESGRCKGMRMHGCRCNVSDVRLLMQGCRCRGSDAGFQKKECRCRIADSGSKITKMQGPKYRVGDAGRCPSGRCSWKDQVKPPKAIIRTAPERVLCRFGKIVSSDSPVLTAAFRFSVVLARAHERRCLTLTICNPHAHFLNTENPSAPHPRCRVRRGNGEIRSYQAVHVCSLFVNEIVFRM